ncbi:MAG TPA: hypothetical protein VG899_10110 [Mycobacteriales bacterium]|nr:hypothetical protein [Mycobacteriales bacterium]
MSEVGVVLRPAAVLPRTEAEKVVEALSALDVSNGGIWNVNPGLWQRYDQPWNGPSGSAGTAQLVGTIGSAYGSPTKYEITLYRVTITAHGVADGWTVERLCDDALEHAGLSLASCPRAALAHPPEHDPFHLAGDHLAEASQHLAS